VSFTTVSRLFHETGRAALQGSVHEYQAQREGRRWQEQDERARRTGKQWEVPGAVGCWSCCQRGLRGCKKEMRKSKVLVFSMNLHPRAAGHFHRSIWLLPA